MGNKRRVFGSLQPKIALASTNMVVNDCQVLLGHPAPAHATRTAKEFALMLAKTMNRSRCVNMSDIYNQAVEVQRKLVAGEALWN